MQYFMLALDGFSTWTSSCLTFLSAHTSLWRTTYRSRATRKQVKDQCLLSSFSFLSKTPREAKGEVMWDQKQ